MRFDADQSVFAALAFLLHRVPQLRGRPLPEYASYLKELGVAEPASKEILHLLTRLSAAGYPVADAMVLQSVPPPGCAIDWKPSVLLPVFAGHQHYDVPDGAPGPLTVYYPALNPFSGDFLAGCGGYPLVIFLHGNCQGDSDHYKRWQRLPYQVARSGYIVVVPRLPGITVGHLPWGSSDLGYAATVLDWIRTGWEHSGYVAREPGTSVIGHSFGAILGAQLVLQIQAAAYVDLSGGFKEFFSTEPNVLAQLNLPGLYTWGSGDDVDAALAPGPGWDEIRPPKHQLVFKDANHFDYLFTDLPCRSARGPCSLVPSLAADYAALFLSRYVPPADANIEGLIPPTLIPPSVVRTPFQEFCASGHLEGLDLLPILSDTCSAQQVVEPQYLFDWTAEFGTEPVAGGPTTCVNVGIGASNIAYRGKSGDLYEVWRDSQGGFGTTNLTENANAHNGHVPDAVGNPFAYVDTARNTEILLYRDSDGTVHSLYWSLGDVGHDNLSGTAGAPNANDDPVGYYQDTVDTHHVIYKGDHGHLHELFWIGVAPVQYGGDLTKLATPPAPSSAGRPSACVDGQAFNNVIFRDGDGYIRRLFWTTGAVTHENLSGFAGTPPAVGDPIVYYTAHDDVKQIVYVGNDGHIWELFWQDLAPVVGWDLMASLTAPAPASALAAYYVPATNTKHVLYRSSDDGGLHELRWISGTGTTLHINIAAAYMTPKADGAPASFVFGGPSTQHDAFRGSDDHLYELVL